MSGHPTNRCSSLPFVIGVVVVVVKGWLLILLLLLEEEEGDGEDEG